MLIVEGPDGGGKSRLIQRLSEDLKYPVAPRVVSKDTQMMVDLVDWVEKNLKNGLQPVIYDRHRLISEPIYGPVLRQNMQPGFDDMTWLYAKQQEIRALEPFVIFCLPPFERVQSNVESDEDNKVVREAIRTIYWLYFHQASTWKNYSSVWDYTADIASDGYHYQCLLDEITGWLYEKGFI
jgi:hypothetical protein